MTATRESAFPLGSILTRPSNRTAFTVATRVAAFLLLFWPAAASSQDSAISVSNGSATAQVAPGEARSPGGSSESPVGSGSDRTKTGQWLHSPPAGTAGGGGDPGAKSNPTGDRVDGLIRATRHPKWKTRWNAVNELGLLKEPRGIPALVERALRDDNPHPRWRSLWAMRTIDRKGTDVVPRLLGGLEDGDPDVLHNAAIALAFFGRPEARAQLLRALSDPIEFRRWEAVYSFRDLGNAAVVDALLPLLDVVNESSTRVRGETALVLGRIGDDRVVPALVRTLRADDSREVRWRAALALMSVGDACLTGVLQDVLSFETDTRVREQINKTIAAMGRSKRRRECPAER